MSMTRNEAVERAAKIWGQAPIVKAIAVAATEPDKRGVWHVDVTVSVGRKLRTDAHALDAHGHTQCHLECTLLEGAASPSPTVEAIRQDTATGARCCRFDIKRANHTIALFTIVQSGADDSIEVYTMTAADLDALIAEATATRAQMG